MKKIFIVAVSLILLVSLSGCSNSAELEQLKKENEELRQRLGDIQNTTTPTITPSTNHATSDVSQNATDLASTFSGKDAIIYEFIDTSEFQNCLTNGIYKCGVDFEPGDYYILSMYGVEAVYAPINNINEKPIYEKKIIRKIHAEIGQYIKLDAALLIPASRFNPTDWKKYGAYKIGEDLPAGEYKIETVTNSYSNTQYSKNVAGIRAAYQISSSDPLGDIIQCNRVSEKQAYITLHDGEYLMINNARLTYTTQ